MIRLCAALACLLLAGCGAALAPAVLGGVLGLGAAGINVGGKIVDIIACQRHDEAGCAVPVPTLALCDDKMISPCLYVGKPKP